MIDEVEIASRYRRLRDAILLEVIRRDPANDLARRLTSSYESSRVDVDEATLFEIDHWNWMVVASVS
jgi:hypothetical protein